MDFAISTMVAEGTMKGKRKGRRGRNTILRSGYGWTLPAQLWQLKAQWKEKRKGRRGGKTILRSGQGWTLPSQLWQLKAQ